MSRSRRVLIMGCGYVGEALAQRLSSAGHTVFGLRRSPPDPGTELPYVPLIGDLTRPESWSHLPGPFDWVANCVSSSRGGVAEYRQVYLEGNRNLLEWLRSHPVSAFAYTSSTSVYGQTDGSWVDETAPTQPGTETGQCLVETEQLLLTAAQEHGIPVRILRVAGIYGPGRGHLFQQFLRGEARLQDQGQRFLNMIHREDVASALEASLERGHSGEVYNACDLEPVTQRDFLQWLADQTGRPLPPPAEPGTGPVRKRGVTHKRVSAAKLRQETNWTPRFPTFREGYAEALAFLRSP